MYLQQSYYPSLNDATMVHNMGSLGTKKRHDIPADRPHQRAPRAVNLREDRRVFSKTEVFVYRFVGAPFLDVKITNQRVGFKMFVNN